MQVSARGSWHGGEFAVCIAAVRAMVKFSAVAFLSGEKFPLRKGRSTNYDGKLLGVAIFSGEDRVTETGRMSSGGFGFVLVPCLTAEEQ